jgi:hypothetical protein
MHKGDNFKPGIQTTANGATFAAELGQSVGSEQHAEGMCKPCAWFWKPGSCSKGRTCEYCHLCDKDSVRRIRQTKRSSKKMLQHEWTRDDAASHPIEAMPLVTMNAEADCKDKLDYVYDACSQHERASLQDVALRSSDVEQPQGLSCNTTGVDANTCLNDDNSVQPLYSKGAVHHSTGMCSPCAWFWKPESCNKGSLCEYCHLCDRQSLNQAILRRKELKRVNRKIKASQQSGSSRMAWLGK